MFLSKNLRYLRRKNNRQTQEELAQALALTRSVISSYEDGRAEPSVTTLINMSAYFKVSIESLTNLDLTNVDEKKASHQKEVKKYASASALKVNSVYFDAKIQENALLVPEKAAAGYVNASDSTHFLQDHDFPKYSLPFLSKTKEYRAFEIRGESMLPLPDKSIVIGEKIEREDIKDGQVCVVVTKDGIVLKKLYDQSNVNGTVLLKSTNVGYKPYEVDASNIMELWKFHSYVSHNIPQEQDDANELRKAFTRMENDIQELRLMVAKIKTNDTEE